MKRLFISIIVAVLIASLSLLLIATNIYFGWLKRPIATPADPLAFAQAVATKVNQKSKGNLVFALLDNWELVAEHTHSKDRPVDRKTLFQLASLSKWVTTYGVLKLVEKGQINLDKPVSAYLTRWSLPDSPYNEEVTVRFILQHAAGFDDGLGYFGFDEESQIQSLEASLTKALDAAPNSSGETSVISQPGTEFRYSGGGFTLLQLLIEEVSGQDFNDYMTDAVFRPLGMLTATFVLSHDDPRLAQTFNEDGELDKHYYYTAKAAASLYASVDDLIAYLRAQATHTSRTTTTPAELPLHLKQVMQQPFGGFMGKYTYGTGSALYGQTANGDWVIGHDGGNRPSINTTARINPKTGDGIVVFSSGDFGLASEIGSDWTFWNTGYVDVITMVTTVQRNLFAIGSTAVFVLIASFLLCFRRLGKAA